jgi:hypothetical protein
MDLARTERRHAESVKYSEYVAHFNGFSSRIRGNYLPSSRRWLAHYRSKQFFVGFYDEILTAPEELLIRIFRFLEVSATTDDIPSQVHTRINQGPEADIPPQLHRHLAELYHEELRGLAEDFGAYPQQWLDGCESILQSSRNT